MPALNHLFEQSLTERQGDWAMHFHPDFSLQTLCHSDTAQNKGLDNTAPPALWPDLVVLSHTLAQVQTLLGSPLKINSGYRCAQLNEWVGGVPNSQHCLGQAVDFTCTGHGDAVQVASTIRDSEVLFDQLILEWGRWVHLSIPPLGRVARRQVLSIWSQARGYEEGIVCA